MTLEQEIITWLEQSVNLQILDAPGRKALLIGAGLGDMQNAVIFGDATLVFCRNVVEYLWNYGQLADGRDPLVALLETAQTLVGTDKRAQCAALIDRLRGEERQPVANQILPPTDANTLAGSSLRIGQARDVTIHQGDQFNSGGGNMNIAQGQATAIQNNYYINISETPFETVREKSINISALKPSCEIDDAQQTRKSCD